MAFCWEGGRWLFLLLLWICSSSSSRGDPSLFVKVSSHHSQIRRSFVFPPRAFVERTDDIRLVGNAAVMSDGSIRIPALDSIANQAGRALFASPVRMWDPNTSLPASFDTTFSFVIAAGGGGEGSRLSESGGLVAPDELTVGREAGFLGMLNEESRSSSCKEKEQQQQQNMFAVEFDTFKNAEFGDPNDNHVGLNLGSVVSKATADLSSVGVYLRNASLVTARISYDGSSRLLELRVSSSDQKQQQEKPPLISAPVDLSGLLSEYMFVGFSASTGADAGAHSIVSWNFSCSSRATQRLPSSELYRGGSQCDEEMLEHRLEQGSKDRRPPAAFFVFLGVSAVCLLTFVNLLIFWRRGGAAQSSKKNQQQQDAVLIIPPRPRPLHRPRKFELQELVAATGDFGEKHKLGQGVLGVFYRGTLQDGSLVAIKRFNPSSPRRSNASSSCSTLLLFSSSSRRRRSEKELLEEVMPAMSRIRHPHVVPLRGWCRSPGGGGGDLLVIYDYMPNGSLDHWLYPSESLTTLPWIHRWKAAKDVAAALAHLHAAGFLHRRLKASNVLLDITFQARIGDFGFTAAISDRSASASEPEMHKQNQHVPPEAAASDSSSSSASSSPWNEKMDVFGFGVLCLELACGRPAMEDETEDCLVDRVWMIHENCEAGDDSMAAAVEQLVDSRLGEHYHLDQSQCLLALGLLCTHPDPNARPAMEMVLSLLDRKMELPSIPSRSSSVSVASTSSA